MAYANKLMHCCNPADSGKRAERPHSGGLPGGRGSGLWITSPFCVDDGNHSDFGKHCGVNGNGPFPGADKVVTGDHAMGVPDVQIYRPCIPPMQQIGSGRREDGSSGFCKTRTHRLSGKSCPDRDSVTVMPGAAIGNDAVTGPGRVFTSDGSGNGIACGVPCQFIREKSWKNRFILSPRQGNRRANGYFRWPSMMKTLSSPVSLS